MAKSLGDMLSGLGGASGIAANKAGISPGQMMFGMSGALGGKKEGDNGDFMSRFGHNLSDLLFKQAMSGFNNTQY